MSIKTMSSVGGVNTVDFGSTVNRFYWCKNIGASTVYVSNNSDITAGADGVAELAKGESVCVESFDGKIYILGAGKVQIHNTGDKFCPFKSAPAQSSGGETVNYISDGLICSSELTDFLAYNTVSDEELGRNVNNCDGVNGYLSKQKTEIMSQIAGNPFTIQVLCKTTQTDEMGMIFGFVFDYAYQSAMLMTYNGCLALERSHGRIKSGTIINNGDWHMLTAAYNGETMRIYADGVLAASENNIWNIPNDAFINIGFWYGDIGYFNGNVTNAVIYNRCLSDTEIAMNWSIDVERYGIGG